MEINNYLLLNSNSNLINLFYFFPELSTIYFLFVIILELDHKVLHAKYMDYLHEEKKVNYDSVIKQISIYFAIN